MDHQCIKVSHLFYGHMDLYGLMDKRTLTDIWTDADQKEGHETSVYQGQLLQWTNRLMAKRQIKVGQVGQNCEGKGPPGYQGQLFQ